MLGAFLAIVDSGRRTPGPLDIELLSQRFAVLGGRAEEHLHVDEGADVLALVDVRAPFIGEIDVEVELLVGRGVSVEEQVQRPHDVRLACVILAEDDVHLPGRRKADLVERPEVTNLDSPDEPCRLRFALSRHYPPSATTVAGRWRPLDHSW